MTTKILALFLTLAYFCSNGYCANFILEPLTIEVPQSLVITDPGAIEKYVSHTLIGAFYDRHEYILNGSNSSVSKNSSESINPYEFLNEVLRRYKSREYDGIENLFAPDIRESVKTRLSDPATSGDFKERLSKFNHFELVCAWLETPDRLIVLVKTDDDKDPRPQILRFIEGRWYMHAGGVFDSPIYHSLGALYSSKRDNSAIKIRLATPTEMGVYLNLNMTTLLNALNIKLAPNP
jgi:hypothetical protein